MIAPTTAPRAAAPANTTAADGPSTPFLSFKAATAEPKSHPAGTPIIAPGMRPSIAPAPTFLMVIVSTDKVAMVILFFVVD